MPHVKPNVLERDGAKCELHELVGINFRLPVWVRRENGTQWSPEKYVRVSLPRISWLPKQRELAQWMLGQACYRKGDASGWILTKEKASQFLVRSNAASPEDVVVWNWQEPTEPCEDFIEAYCAHRDSLIRDPAQAAIVWASFQKVMFELLKKGKPLDLIFGKVTSFPLRRNWLAILTMKYRAVFRWKGGSFDSLRKKHLGETLTAWDEKNAVIQWSLSIMASEKYEEAMRAIEFERKRGLRADRRYALRVKQLLKSYEDRILAYFKTHIEKTNQKVLRIPKGALRRQPNLPRGIENWPALKRVRFKEYLQRQLDKLNQQDALAGPPPSDGNCAFRVVESEGSHVHVASPDESVLSLPHLQSLCPDVRDAGGDVAAAGQTEHGEGAIGMFMPPTLQEQTSSELLAVGAGPGPDASAPLAGSPEQLPDPADRTEEPRSAIA